MKKIVTTYATVEKLSKTFGVSIISVYKALRFATKGDRPDKIRQAALAMGAVLLKSEDNNQ